MSLRLLLTIYTLSRLLSFILFKYEIPLISSALALSCLGSVIFLAQKNRQEAGLIVAAEMLMGGSGQIFSFFGISLRTLLLAGFALGHITRLIVEKNLTQKNIKKSDYLIFIFFGIAGLATLNGFYRGHAPNKIFGDLLSLAPLILGLSFLPFPNLKKLKNYINTSLIGNLTLSALTAIWFARVAGKSAITLRSDYYRFFRDILGGKITHITDQFYRVVLPEDILLPIIIILFGNFAYLSFGKILLSLGRANLISSIAPLIFFARKSLKKSGQIILGGLIIFITVSYLMGANTQIALGALGFRLKGGSGLSVEESAATRGQLLTPALKTSLTKPILGQGLGAQIQNLPENLNQKITDKTQFDWGYLEIASEYGLPVTIFLLFSLYILGQKLRQKKENRALAGLLALVILTIFTPALFHSLGTFALAMIIRRSNEENALFE